MTKKEIKAAMKRAVDAPEAAYKEFPLKTAVLAKEILSKPKSKTNK